MIQDLRSSTEIPTASPTVWGLTPRQLHDAYWHGRGVQCVRRGEMQELQPAAEIFLLIEPDQLVLFDLADLSERLTWHDAAVTRVRVMEREDEPYSEHVVLDDAGLVHCIERRYSQRERASHRVCLTHHRRLARTWMSAESGREAWDRVRRSVPWSRVDHCKNAGQVFLEGDPEQECACIDALVEAWPLVAQSIEGLEEASPGVWHVAGEGLEPGVVRLGPYWVGLGGGERGRRCVVGPAWTPDDPDWEGHGRKDVSIRPIADVEMVGPAAPRRQPLARRTVYAFVKRLIDIVGSLSALVVLSPVMLVIAYLIFKEDGGPVFFRHTRQGRHGRPFECLKFRTMHLNAEAFARELEDRNLADGPQVYIIDDPRVTAIGRALRRRHLDELPQFWNVLVGRMSLVGPRPSPDDENQYCPAWRDMRLSVRPGITGLWQLERTREPGEDFQEWIKYDMEYVRQAGLWLDMKILARTFWAYLPWRPGRAAE